MPCQDQSAPEPLSGFIQYRPHGPTLLQWVQHPSPFVTVLILVDAQSVHDKKLEFTSPVPLQPVLFPDLCREATPWFSALGLLI
ncbi:hypothetical protein BT67DRAFT_440919 [Trichocladium antarcticum]|uniref:Uncharacterized protein n=1 Tax=Trichocladium antarcticum TaxID=1450529 RepID=A0AAN6ZF73_9PEZI|nr:hypothetical protein BT67DRAFT_440919 [Trichocladium antarcticum]